MRSFLTWPFLLVLGAGLLGAESAQAQAMPGVVLERASFSSATAEAFHDTLDPLDAFGSAAVSLGDLDGNGMTDLVVGAPRDRDGGSVYQSGRGALWVLLRDVDGSILTRHKISTLRGGFTDELDDGGGFGSALALLGDVDGDGNPDIAAGAPGDDPGDYDNDWGAVWVLFLNVDGSLRESFKIEQTDPIDPDFVLPGDEFGHGVAPLGDLDGDGVPDLAAGAPGDESGVVYLLLLNPDGSQHARITIDDGVGGVPGLHFGDHFGASVANLGDLDGNGVADLAVGATHDDDGGLNSNRGALWILFLDSTGRVQDSTKISQTAGGFSGTLAPEAHFGSFVAAVGDRDGDGVSDLAVATGPVAEGGTGEVWILHLNADGSVKSQTDLDADPAVSWLDPTDALGDGLGFVPDLDGSGVPALLLGATGDDDGSLGDPQADRGALYMLSPDPRSPSGAIGATRKLSEATAGFQGTTDDVDSFGSAIAVLGDLDGNGVDDIVIGAPADDDEGPQRGALWIGLLAEDASLLSIRKLNGLTDAMLGPLSDEGLFGSAVAGLGDLDGDGVPDLAVSSPEDLDGAGSIFCNYGPGVVRILFLNPDGSVKSVRKLSVTAGGLPPDVMPCMGFGASLARLGDLDGDGVIELAVGAPYDADSGPVIGATYILFLNADGSLKASQKISTTQGGFTGAPDYNDRFGASVGAPGDLNGDGIPDLAVGAPGDTDGMGPFGFAGAGAVWVLFLNADGTVQSHTKLSKLHGGVVGLQDGAGFGHALTGHADLDGDGVGDLVAGLPGDDGGLFSTFDSGAALVLFLKPDGTLKQQQKLSPIEGQLDLPAIKGDDIGRAVAAADIDADGLPELVLTSAHESELDLRGDVHVLTLNAAWWTQQPGGVAGSHGKPTLDGQGALLGDDLVTLSVASALENTIFSLVIGLSTIDASFKGGVWVPSVDILVAGIPTGPAGEQQLSFAWPSGLPAGLQLWYQVWVTDPGGPLGFAGSNALKSRTP